MSLDPAADPSRLYVAVGDDVNPARPLFTGDVLNSIDIPGVGESAAIIIGHPCSIRGRGGALAERLPVAAVREHQKVKAEACPSCRRIGSRDLCECGGTKQPTSVTCRTCQPTAGETNGHWRGGTTRHKAGYLMRRAPSHPRARPKSPYGFEHILVMERKIGRLLLADETVHHLNGVKDDNRPENLELWVRPQPSGIRGSDAVEWTRTIIARYERAPGSSNNAQDES